MIPQLDPEPETTIDQDIAAIEDDPSWITVGEAEIALARRQGARDAILMLQDQLNEAGLVVVPHGVALAGERWLAIRAQAIRDICPSSAVREAERAFESEFSGIPFNRDADHG